jgi:ribosomal protein L11 methyltransferase
LVPYRLDLDAATAETFDRIVELGALDAELTDAGALAAVMPDAVDPARVARALGVRGVRTSAAIGRDAGSVWILRPREVRIGPIRIVPAHAAAEPGVLRLADSSAFGTGLHATTALCVDALHEIVGETPPDSLLDVGTGSGILALAALLLGVPRAHAIDTDARALLVTAENARLNGVGERLQVTHGGPEAISGTWPLVVANILAAPLIEVAPALVRRVGHHGQLVLSGIPMSVEPDVDLAYRRLGMRRMSARAREGWMALVLQGAW